MAKVLIFQPELTSRICAGSGTIRSTVEANFGPEGRNTIREQTYDLPVVANTGRQALREISLQDAAENLSVKLVRDAALQVAQECGDGSIATTVLSDLLIAAGYQLIRAGYEPIGLRRGLYMAISVVRRCLEGITIPFLQVPLKQFAFSVAKNDEVAENVAIAFEKVGVDGVISVQDTQGRDTTLQFWDGVRYDYGLLNMAFMTDHERKKAVLTEPYVLLSNVKIKSVQEIQKILEDVIRTGASLLIITNDMSEELQRMLAMNATHGLKIALAKAPGYGDTRRRNMLALAAKIGSLLFDENTGIEMKDCGLDVCCQIGRAEVSKDDTVLQGFRDTSAEMVDILRRHTQACLQQTSDPDEQEKLMGTLSILNGQSAEIRVGAVVEYEMFEKKYLYENTIRSVQGGARSGLVPGGCNIYLYLAEKIVESSADWPEIERLGACCLSKSLQELSTALLENAGITSAVTLSHINTSADPYLGYDVIRHKMVDLKAAGILMPRSTVETIITVASETAGALWTTEAAVAEV